MRPLLAPTLPASALTLIETIVLTSLFFFSLGGGMANVKAEDVGTKSCRNDCASEGGNDSGNESDETRKVRKAFCEGKKALERVKQGLRKKLTHKNWNKIELHTKVKGKVDPRTVFIKANNYLLSPDGTP